MGISVQGRKKKAQVQEEGRGARILCWWHGTEVISRFKIHDCGRQCKSQDLPLTRLYTI